MATTLPAPAEQTHRPLPRRHPHAWRIAAISGLAGLTLAIFWSFTFVDSVIGGNVASSLMGEDAEHLTITNLGAGVLFAVVSGLAGTFTACNAAAAAAFAPMSELRCATGQSLGGIRALLTPIAYLTLGMTLVAGSYGFLGVIFAEHLPQLSTGSTFGIPDRLLQASLVFGIIGLALTSLGLASLGLIKDPFRDRPTLRVLTLGALIGAFLIGRPYPLFNKLFRWTAEQDQPFLGAGVFILQSLGNITLMVLLYAAAAHLSRGRALTWLTHSATRSQLISGALLIALGAFTFIYWDLRVPAQFGFGWFPLMPYE